MRRVMDKSMNIFEVETDENTFESRVYRDKKKDFINQGLEEEILEKEKAKGRRIRDPLKACEIPDKRLIAKFISSDLGTPIPPPS
jgi:hypothetical protein